MKKIAAVFITLILVSYPVLAADSQFTANAAFTSDYVSHGISQSDGHPTLQGGVDWVHPDTGFYAGLWGSGVDFTDANIEVDVYGGISKSIDKLTWDVGALYYFYPGTKPSLNYNFWEAAVAVGYNFDVMLATLSLNYSPESFGKTGDAWYPAININVPLPHAFSLDAGYGRQWIEKNDIAGIPDYNTWLLGVNYNIEGFTLSLKYTDTDLGEPVICPDNCDARTFFMVSRSF